MNIYMRERIEKIYLNANYKSLLKNSSLETKPIIWGKGIAPPFSILPYEFEMQGIRRGKLLKHSPKKINKNLFLLWIDNNNNNIACKEYCSLGAEDRWIVQMYFYIYSDEELIEYRFGSGFEDDRDDIYISSVCLCRCNDTAIKNGYYYSGDTYSEYQYTYHDGKISTVCANGWMWDLKDNTPEFETIYDFLYTNSGMQIIRTDNSCKEVIYTT